MSAATKSEPEDMEAARIAALAKHLECEADELSVNGHDEYLVEHSRREYLVMTDSEADERAGEYIRESLWAFNASFIIDHSKLPTDAEEMVKSFQQDKCEGANETIEALIEDMEEFVSDAISADGRAHFLNTYDDEEHEIKTDAGLFYVYRVQ